jgi:glycosyltransferase involved in cell wall biosynthesis
MAKTTRLLYVINDAAFFLSHRLRLAIAAAEAGYEVHVATPDSPVGKEIRSAGLVFHPVVFSRRGMNPLEDFRSLRLLYQLYRSLRPNLVHHVTIKPVLYGGIAARFARVPAVVSAISGLGHVFVAGGIKAKALRFLVTRAYSFALAHPNSRVIFQNPDDQQVLVLNGLLPAQSAVLIKGAGVDMTEFAPSPEIRGTPVVLFASRMLWTKGASEFVDTARRLQANGVSARFVLVGEPDEGNPMAIPADELRAWAQSGAVEWIGRSSDMPTIFAQSHIVCLPTTYGEGVPKVLIEAAACGRPIVATDVPGCREIVRQNDNGLLVPANDSAALANALRHLIADPALRARMGRRGREIAVQEFGLDRVITETLSVYQTLLAAPHGGSFQGDTASEERRSA